MVAALALAVPLRSSPASGTPAPRLTIAHASMVSVAESTARSPGTRCATSPAQVSIQSGEVTASSRAVKAAAGPATPAGACVRGALAPPAAARPLVDRMLAGSRVRRCRSPRTCPRETRPRCHPPATRRSPPRPSPPGAAATPTAIRRQPRDQRSAAELDRRSRSPCARVRPGLPVSSARVGAGRSGSRRPMRRSRRPVRQRTGTPHRGPENRLCTWEARSIRWTRQPARALPRPEHGPGCGTRAGAHRSVLHLNRQSVLRDRRRVDPEHARSSLRQSTRKELRCAS